MRRDPLGHGLPALRAVHDRQLRRLRHVGVGQPLESREFLSGIGHADGDKDDPPVGGGLAARIQGLDLRELAGRGFGVRFGRGVLPATVESAVLALVAIIGGHLGQRFETNGRSWLLRQHCEERQSKNKCEHQVLPSPHHDCRLSKSIPNSDIGWPIQSTRHSSIAKAPVKNEDLWKRLDEARKRHDVAWRWVKGHAGHELNERADALARQGLKQTLEAS